MSSFWNKLPKPIMVLAPLANVTDASFRRIIAECSRHTRKDGTEGGPDVMWTEFVSADGLVCASAEGKKKLLADLMYTEGERPIVAQLFTSNPNHMEAAAKLCAELGFDGVDINMGCPDKTIEKQGCGSAMIKDPDKAALVIRAAKRGVKKAGKDIPVSVKTRIGYNKNELDTWLPVLLAERPAVITLHARTRKEMSKVPARWEHVHEAVVLRNMLQADVAREERTLILGNGDAISLADAKQKVEKSGADGAMLGRAIFGNPWLFNPFKSLNADASSLLIDPSKTHTIKDIEIVSVAERLTTLVKHTKLFEELLPFKNFALMKKHYKAYVHNFDGAKELRMELMEKDTAHEVELVINRWLKEGR